MPIIPPGFLNLTYHFDIPAADPNAIITMGVSGTETAAQGKMELIFNALADTILPQLTHDVALTSVVASTQDGAVLQYENRTTGGKNQQGLPPNSAWLLRKVTNKPGRKQQGRSYLPGVPIGDTNAFGAIAPGILADMTLAGSQYLVAMFQAGFEVVLLHSDVATLPTTVAYWQPAPIIATQRRRLRD